MRIEGSIHLSECIPAELLAAETRQNPKWLRPYCKSRCLPVLSASLHCVGPFRFATRVSERLTSPACNISPLAAASSCELHAAVCFASSNTPHRLLSLSRFQPSTPLPLALFFFFLPPLHPALLALPASTSE